MKNFQEFVKINEGRGVDLRDSCVSKGFDETIYLSLRKLSVKEITEYGEKIIQDLKSLKPDFSPTPIKFSRRVSTSDGHGKPMPIDNFYVKCKPIRLYIGEGSHAFYSSFYSRNDLEAVIKVLNSTMNSLISGSNASAKVTIGVKSDTIDFFDLWYFNKAAGGKADEIMKDFLHGIRGKITARAIGVV